MVRLGLVVLLVGLTACAEPKCPEEACVDYYRVSDAQRDFDADPTLCAALDENGDGQACNEAGNAVTMADGGAMGIELSLDGPGCRADTVQDAGWRHSCGNGVLEGRGMTCPEWA